MIRVCFASANPEIPFLFFLGLLNPQLEQLHQVAPGMLFVTVVQFLNNETVNGHVNRSFGMGSESRCRERKSFPCLLVTPI